MSVLAIEINDAGLVVADAGGARAIEPGYALVDRGKITVGVDAQRAARLKPRYASNRYWSSLSVDPGSGVEGGQSAAELAFAQLAALWKPFAAEATDVLLVVPGDYGTEQLGLLLGLAQECGIPVRALVDAAAAASVRPYPGRQLLHVDAGLHRVSVTHIQQSDAAAVHTERRLGHGLAALMETFARRVADLFVRGTRFDPFRHAETEQLVYDRLPDWFAALERSDSAELALTYRNDEFRVTAARDALLPVANGFYRAVVQLIAQQREPGASVAVQLADRLASLPGFVAELARLDDALVVPLPPGHAAVAALGVAGQLARDGDIKLLKRIAWRAPAAEPAPASADAAPARQSRRGDAPTHVVHRGTVYRIGPRGILVGREAVEGRHTIVIADQSGGVSREHCELAIRDGELRLRDLSRYGTFVNEKRVSGEIVLERADVIRIGTPGAELTVVGLEQGDAAA
jgi:hypothetical protein